MEFNRVNINCFDKTMMFPKLEESKNLRFMFLRKIYVSLRGYNQMLMMFASLRVERERLRVLSCLLCMSSLIISLRILVISTGARS